MKNLICFTFRSVLFSMHLKIMSGTSVMWAWCKVVVHGKNEASFMVVIRVLHCLLSSVT